MSSEDFTAVVVAHKPALVRVGYLLCHDMARAEDLVQDVLMKAVRRWDRDPPVHVHAYLRRAVVNEYLSWRRRRMNWEIPGLPSTEQAYRDTTSSQLDERDEMWRLLGNLKPRARAVLVLRYYEQMPDLEIAELLGCAVATVRSIAARAIADLRADPSLADYGLTREPSKGVT